MPTLTPEQVEEAARVMPDHTLATAFLEPDARARVIALILFTHEISRARAVVSEAGLGAIRLQWWRDVIEQVYTGQTVRAQPTAIALKGAIEEASLPRTMLDAMIDGYEAEMTDMPFASWADLDTYLDATMGNFNRVALLSAGLPALSTGADQAARHAGIAWGLASLIGATPTWFARRCTWLPKEVHDGLDQEALFAGHVSMELRDKLKAVTARIQAECRSANQALKKANLGVSFPTIAPACLAKRIAACATPTIGTDWRVKAQPSLLERQIRTTICVARNRL